MSEALKQRVDLLAIVVNKLVTNQSLTEEQAYNLADIAHNAEKSYVRYKEEARAYSKMIDLQLKLDTLYADYPHLKPKQ